MFSPRRPGGTRRGWSIGLLALVGLALSGLALAGPASADPNNATKVISSQFPDPGFAHFGARYYLYATGGGFKAASSTSPTGPYSEPARSMADDPDWVGTAPDGGRHLWAPNVIQTTDVNGNPMYVMYFTGYNVRNGWNANCVGVATSSQPDTGFVAYGGPICSLNNDHEAIDPTAFQDPQTGKRWIVFKTNVGNVRDFRIQAIQMSADATTIVPNTRRTLVASDSAKMEAPSLIVRDGKVWLFLARNDFGNCSYSTDARSTSSFESNAWSAPTTVMSQASIDLCGPGGATVIQDTDGKAYIAFHAWQNKTPSSGVRQTWVGKLGWGSGVPVLY